jgi:ankyrin repeat protein
VDVSTLERLLREHPDLVTARIDGARTLLHVATDWPGHYPRGAATVAALVAAGADVSARFTGAHTETPLHWAASSNDLEVLDALIAAGADIEADGAVIAGGTPLSDAVAFGQWEAARRLIEAGARPTFREAAALGLAEHVRERCEGDPAPTAADLSEALWYAAHGGRQEVAEDLVGRGADIDWVAPWDGLTPLDAARRSDATDLAEWLLARGAASATDRG